MKKEKLKNRCMKEVQKRTKKMREKRAIRIDEGGNMKWWWVTGTKGKRLGTVHEQKARFMIKGKEGKLGVGNKKIKEEKIIET